MKKEVDPVYKTVEIEALPKLGAPRKMPAEFLAILLDTITSGKAVEVPLQGEDWNSVVGIRLRYFARKHLCSLHSRELLGTRYAWLEKKGGR